MINFDDLPHTKRMLILATLELEIAEANCTNILDLARKRHQAIHDIWRDVCRKTGQPHCTVPAPVMATRDQWLESMTAAHSVSTTATSAGPTIVAFSETPTVTSLEAPTAPYLESPMPTSLKSPTATPSAKAGSVNTGARAVPVKRAGATHPSASGGHRAHHRRGLLVAGLVVILAVGVGLLVLVASSSSTVAPQASLKIPNAKPGDVIREGTIIRDRRDAGGCSEQTDQKAGRTPSCGDKPEFDPASVPPPAGTIRRLDAISKSFGKR